MIVYNGKSLTDFACHVDELDSLVRPDWDTTKIEIPGRNGDLTLSNGRFKNVTLSYDCMIAKDFLSNYASLLAFLKQDANYHKLETDSEKDTFRMATVADISDPKIGAWFQRGTFTLKFDCKPQRFLKSGNDSFEIKNGSSFFNQYLFPTFPILRVYGWGTIKINNYQLLLNKDTTTPYIDIDCDLKDAYYGSLNRNSFLEITSWPMLDPGNNVVELGDNIEKVEITPRWWTI